MKQTIKTLRSSWMGYLLDHKQDLSLTALTIPGTHDTGTWDISGGDIAPMSAKCQDMDLMSQLKHGIRFIDIRLVPEYNSDTQKDDMAIYHSSVPGNVWFSAIINDCRSFLKDNNKETIIMSIKNEHEVPDATFVTALDKFIDKELQSNSKDLLFYTSNNVPKLSDSAGQIVLFRRYNGSAKGIDGVTGWPHDNETNIPTAGHVPMMIQDVYTMAVVGQGGTKWRNHIQKFLQAALLNNDAVQTWWINFASTSGGGYPTTFATEINPLLQTWLEGMIQTQQSSLEAYRLGTVLLDFPTPRLMDALIAMNITDVSLTILQNHAYTLRLSNNKAYIGQSYKPGSWNYAQNYTDSAKSNLVLHSLVKVDGQDSFDIHHGDTVRILSTQFTNDAYVYIESHGENEDKGGINLFYDNAEGSYEKNPEAVEWVIEYSPSNANPDKQGFLERGDIVRFRSILKKDCYLLAATDQYLSVEPLDYKDVNKYIAGGFDWVVE